MLYSAFLADDELFSAIWMQSARESFFSAVSALVAVEGHIKKNKTTQRDNKNPRTKVTFAKRSEGQPFFHLQYMYYTIFRQSKSFHLKAVSLFSGVL